MIKLSLEFSRLKLSVLFDTEYEFNETNKMVSVETKWKL